MANKKPGARAGLFQSILAPSLFALGLAFGGSGLFGSSSGGRGFSVLGSLFGGKGLGSGDLFGFAGFARGLGGFALAGLDLAGAGAGRFENTGRLAATITQVIELGATDLTALDHFHRSEDRKSVV